MIRRVLLTLAVGLVAVLAYACAPYLQATPPSSHSMSASAPAVMTCDPTPFTNKIYTLDSGFNPGLTNATTPPYQPPSGVIAAPDPYKTDLGTAYCNASTSFQKQLMQLQNVFITCANPQHCNSSGADPLTTSTWGYRENKINQSTNQYRYVALSAELWQGNNLPKYSKFERQIFDALIGSNNLNVKFTPGNDSGTLTAMAALAHEMGHIYWWVDDIQNSTCGGAAFSGFSWSQISSTSQFHLFGVETSGTNGNQSRGNADKDKVKTDKGNSSAAYIDLGNIYNGDWASLFATVSPDEDFVETYKLWILTTAQTGPLTSLEVTVNNQDLGDVVAWMSTSVGQLYNKSNWIQSCLSLP